LEGIVEYIVHLFTNNLLFLLIVSFRIVIHENNVCIPYFKSKGDDAAGHKRKIVGNFRKEVIIYEYKSRSVTLALIRRGSMVVCQNLTGVPDGQEFKTSHNIVIETVLSTVLEVLNTKIAEVEQQINFAA